MGGYCTNSTTLRLISNNGFRISEHSLAILFDIWNKLHYTRHIKYNRMDHLTGICLKNSHSSAFAWLSWYAGSEFHVPSASLPLICLWQSHAHFLPKSGIYNSGHEVSSIIFFLFWRRPWCQGLGLCDHFSRESGCQLYFFLPLWVVVCGPPGMSTFSVTMLQGELLC